MENTLSAEPETKVSHVPLRATGYFKEILLRYIEQAGLAEAELAPFYYLPPTQEGLAQAASERLASYDVDNRKIVVEALRRQYAAIGEESGAAMALDKLSKGDTLTVTTGHQLAIYTGPLYTLLKAATAIKLAREVERLQPGAQVVPIFWLSSEDHDLEEIRHVSIYGRPLTWEVAGTGPAGPLPLTGLRELLAGLNAELPDWIARYTSCETLAQGHAWLLHYLFGSEGLLVLDASVPELKTRFIPLMRRELTDSFVQPAVEGQTVVLEKLGHKAQIAVREINLFYLSSGERNRIIRREDGSYQLGSATFSQEKVLELLRDHPECFSPNVAMRPLYQETLLPNVAYVGGPAEVAYWLQLGRLFAETGLFMPIVWPRKSALVLTAKDAARLADFGLDTIDMFKGGQAVRQKVLVARGEARPDFSEEQAAFTQMLDNIGRKGILIDKTLAEALAADRVRLDKQLEPMYRKIEKAWERRHEAITAQAEKLREKLFPGEGLQERHENFLTWQLADGGFASQLFAAVNPLDLQFALIELAPPNV